MGTYQENDTGEAETVAANQGPKDFSRTVTPNLSKRWQVNSFSSHNKDSDVGN